MGELEIKKHIEDYSNMVERNIKYKSFGEILIQKLIEVGFESTAVNFVYKKEDVTCFLELSLHAPVVSVVKKQNDSSLKYTPFDIEEEDLDYPDLLADMVVDYSLIEIHKL